MLSTDVERLGAGLMRVSNRRGDARVHSRSRVFWAAVCVLGAACVVPVRAGGAEWKEGEVSRGALEIGVGRGR